MVYTYAYTDNIQTDIYTDTYSIGIYDTDIYGPIYRHIRIYT